MEETYFPQDKTEYYYYFQIQKIEKAKDIYNRCNGAILNNTDNKAKLKEVVFDNSIDCSISTYKKLFDDFNKYADKLINCDGINSIEEFNKYINMLMVITNETIEYTESLAYCKRKEIKKIKLIYNDKKLTADKIWKDNFKLPSLINSDEPMNVFFNMYGRLIMDIILILVTLFAFTSTVLIIDKFTMSIQNLVSLIVAGILDITTIYIAFLWLSSRKLLNLTDTKNQIYKRNYNYINHAFSKSQWGKQIFNFIRYTIETIKKLK